jgi:hypothetical protein
MRCHYPDLLEAGNEEIAMIDEESERHEIEALLPWYAAGTLSRRDRRSRRAGACPRQRTRAAL